MCRNIRPLFNFDPPATREEIGDASLQFVRKIAGLRAPSQRNQKAFQVAVREVTDAAERLLGALVTQAPPRDRAVDADRRRARSARRFGVR